MSHRLADADLKGSLGDRNEHVVQNTDATNEQGNTGDEYADAENSADNAVERAEQRVELVNRKVIVC